MNRPPAGLERRPQSLFGQTALGVGWAQKAENCPENWADTVSEFTVYRIGEVVRNRPN